MSKYIPGAILGGVRKAFASKGDDATFSRFVKVKPGEVDPQSGKVKKRKPARHQWKFDGFANPSIEAGRSLFYRKGLKRLDQVSNVLVSGHCNVKIGRDVRKGRLKGYWIYTLTLEERATCPRSCAHWQTCYGNNMPWAKRVEHSPELLERLDKEIAKLLAVRSRRGILIRLHALGDFYSRDYVWFWRDMLWKYPNLAIFGYTAWEPDSDIGFAVGTVKRLFEDRFAIRWSNQEDEETWSTRTVVEPIAAPGTFLCPEQTGKVDGCGKCGACWSTAKNVSFIQH